MRDRPAGGAAGTYRDLTVVVPTRDERANVPALLTSLPRAVRLIVVDASTDGTPRLIARLRPDRTRVVFHQGGIAAARHAGAQLAETPWLVFSDADVAFAPDYFDRLAAGIARTAAGDRQAGWYGPKLSRGAHRRYCRACATGQQLADRLGVPAASGSNMVVRREAYFAVGGFDPALPCNEDSELGWRLARAGLAFRYAPDLIVYATDHRRLDAGRTCKTLHSLVRCTLLYLDLLPPRWRSCDWGYWRDREAGHRAPATIDPRR